MCEECEGKSGIYAIINSVNGKAYIGQAQDLDVRKNTHYKRLRGNYHPNKHLQRAWNKYGEEKFTHTVLGYCEVDELDQLEIDYIDFFDTTDRTKGYNQTLGGGGTRGYKHTDEARKKMSESRSGEDNPTWGKPKSEEHKKKISEANKGKKRTEETRKKMSKARKGENSHMWGKFGKDNHTSVSVVQLNKETGEFIAEYGSGREAGKELGIYNSNISEACKGKKKSAGGYIWQYAKDYYKQQKKPKEVSAK